MNTNAIQMPRGWTAYGMSLSSLLVIVFTLTESRVQANGCSSRSYPVVHSSCKPERRLMRWAGCGVRRPMKHWSKEKRGISRAGIWKCNSTVKVAQMLGWRKESPQTSLKGVPHLLVLNDLILKNGITSFLLHTFLKKWIKWSLERVNLKHIQTG